MKYFYVLFCFALLPLSESFASSQSIRIKAEQYLKEYQTTCSKLNNVWKMNLCRPIAIIDKTNLEVITNQIDPDKTFKKSKDIFYGKYYGPQVFANTAIKWGDDIWSTVLWPLPEDSNYRIDLLIHESWHGIQSKLGFPAHNALLIHLDRYKGRKYIQLEWNAILAAINDKKSRKKHLQHALYFREKRFEENKEYRKKERKLDFNEGLAAYTGYVARNLQPETQNNMSFLKVLINQYVKLPSMTRSASYVTGPLYGSLLDIIHGNWKTHIKSSQGFGELVRIVYTLSKEKDWKPQYEDYDLKKIDSYEKPREKQRVKIVSEYLGKLNKETGLMLSPTPGKPHSFDPRSITMISENDAIYKVFSTTDVWGKLTVSEGIRIIWEKNSSLYLLSHPIEVDGKTVKGSGWKLELASNWYVKKENNRWVLLEK